MAALVQPVFAVLRRHPERARRVVARESIFLSAYLLAVAVLVRFFPFRAATWKKQIFTLSLL